jgi:tRNA-dihydrouridine synthase B
MMFSSFPFMLAPMAEISTPALRSCIASFAPDTILYTEMLSANLLLHGGIFNNALLQKNESEKTVYQLLGKDPVILRDASQKLEALSPYAIDINMGCSAPDILKTGGGACLLKEPDRAREIIKTVRAAVRCPVSVKIRTGWNTVDLSFTREFCTMLEHEGASWITIHPRAAKQGFRGAADWKIIASMKEALSVPVVGNGDIIDAYTAHSRISSGMCDAVMIGRAAVQKPWIFGACRQTGGSSTTVDLAETASAILDGIRTQLPPELHTSRALRFLSYYTKNFTFGHSLFTLIRKEESIDAMKEHLIAYCDRNINERTVSF